MKLFHGTIIDSQSGIENEYFRRVIRHPYPRNKQQHLEVRIYTLD